MDRLKKASKIELASSFADSKVIGQSDSIPTAVPALNIAFSGDIHGGVVPGLTMFAGESRSFVPKRILTNTTMRYSFSMILKWVHQRITLILWKLT